MHICGAFHEAADVRAGRRDREKADSRQHGITSADVVRNDKALIAFAVRQGLQCAARLVGRRVDALCGAFLAVLLLGQFLEDAECDGRLGGGAGFRDDVHGEVAVSEDLQKLGEIGPADGVAGIVDLRRLALFFGQFIVEVVVQELICRTCPEVGAADADHEQHVGILADLRRGLFDADELFLVVIDRKIDPAPEIRARAAAVEQHLLRGFRALLHGLKRLLIDEFLRLRIIKSDLHSFHLPVFLFCLARIEKPRNYNCSILFLVKECNQLSAPWRFPSCFFSRWKI